MQLPLVVQFALEGARKPDYVGEKIWRIGPTVARPEFPPTEHACCQFYLGSEHKMDFRPLPKWQVTDNRRFFIHLPVNMSLAARWDQSRNLVDMMMSVAGQPAACVLHTGTRSSGRMEYIGQRLNRLLLPRSTLPFSLLLEPPAGEGQKIGADWDDLRRLFETLDTSNPLGLCLDTQHMFGAGMCDFSSEVVVEQMLDVASHICRVGLIHLNDSMVPLGSRKDAHEAIGRGHIWMEEQSSLRRLLELCHQADVDMVTETGIQTYDYQREICRSLLTTKVGRP